MTELPARVKDDSYDTLAFSHPAIFLASERRVCAS